LSVEEIGDTLQREVFLAGWGVLAEQAPVMHLASLVADSSITDNSAIDPQLTLQLIVEYPMSFS
jgi:hypothetical protein